MKQLIIAISCMLFLGCATFKKLRNATLETKVCHVLCSITTTMPEICYGDFPNIIVLLQRAPSVWKCVDRCDGLPPVDPNCVMQMYGKLPIELTCEDLLNCFDF